MFRRIHWNNRGCKSIVWRCISKLEPTGLECHARTINELDLQEIVLTALNELLGDKSKYQKQLQQNIASVIRASAATTTDGIDEKLMELQQELVKKARNTEHMTRENLAELLDYSVRHVQSIENDGQFPSIQLLESVSSFV